MEEASDENYNTQDNKIPNNNEDKQIMDYVVEYPAH